MTASLRPVAARLFLTADGEKDKPWGNETIRWHPDEDWLEVKLPAPLSHLANRPHGRYQLTCPARFTYRGDEVAAQAMSGAVRYDITCDPVRNRWYIDASWKTSPAPAAALDELRTNPVVAVDVNTGHLAVAVVTADGNVLGTPVTIGLDLAGLPATARDGRLRAAISTLIATARQHGARAVVIEDLDFANDQQRSTVSHSHRPCLHLPVGDRALARPAAGAPPGGDRAPCGSAGDRATRARAPGQASRDREPARPGGGGTASPGATQDHPGGRART